MSSPKWINWDFDDCERCGDGVEVYTSATQRGGGAWVHDGDTVRCVSCALRGAITLDAETDAYVIWSDQEEGDHE